MRTHTYTHTQTQTNIPYTKTQTNIHKDTNKQTHRNNQKFTIYVRAGNLRFLYFLNNKENKEELEIHNICLLIKRVINNRVSNGHE
jgi:hypothetical protein